VSSPATGLRSSGWTGAELAGLATAYGQVQAKGRLQGEELLQFQERGVALQQVLRDEYGLSGAEFQKALEGGKISAEAVEFALRKLTDSGGKYANGAIAQSDTLNGRLSTLQDSIQVLAQTVGRKLEPEFKKVLNVAISLTGQIQQMVSLMDNLGGQRRELDWQREADLATDRFAKQAGWNPLVEQGKRYEFRQLYMAQKRADYDLSQQGARATNAAPPSTAPPPLSGGGGGSDKNSNPMAELLRRIRSGEGSYTSINRGRAGDTPGGMPGLTNMSVGQVMEMQKAGRAFAVGAYQFIPKTLEGAVKRLGIDSGERFSPGLQDKLAQELILGGTKRPALSAYLTGRSNNAGRAESDASLEWAALTGPGGRGAYDGVAGNKGSISIRDLLPLVRKQVMEGKVGDDLSQDIFDARKKRDEEAQQLEKLRKDGLLTSARQLAILERQADVTRAITSEEKITASSDLARTERMYKFIDLLKEAQGDEQQMNVLRQQQLELDRAQLEYGLQLNDALLRRVGISGELLDQSRFTGTGSGAREQTFDLKGTLADTSPAEEKIDRLEQAAESSSQAIGGLFRDIISGTATAEESLARTFQSIADSFASMVSDMIAEWAKAQIIGLFRNVAGPIAGAVGGGFGATSGDLFGQGLGVQGSLLSFAGGGHTGSSPRSGGVDGQGGFPAILHPQETVIDHTRMMPVPYQTSPAAAATGELAVPYQSSGQALSVPFLKTGGGDGGAASMPLDNEPIRYESRIVDGVETVTKEQAEEIGRRTEQRVLKRLQNSPGARRAVGIG
jgi:tape measure domain-containing protein